MRRSTTCRPGAGGGRGRVRTVAKAGSRATGGCSRRSRPGLYATAARVMIRPEFMTPTAFATSRPLAPEELEAAPARTRGPRGSWRRWSSSGPRPARGRDARSAHRRRPARAPPARSPRGARGGRAGRRRERDGRRRGQGHLLALGPPPRDAAAGRGEGRRRQRLDDGDVLQPAVAGADATRPGARLVLHGKFEARNRFGYRLTRSRPRRPTAATRSPTTRRRRALPRPRSLRSCAATRRRSATCSSRCRRGCGPASGFPTARRRLPLRTSRAPAGVPTSRRAAAAGAGGTAARATRVAAPPAAPAAL